MSHANTSCWIKGAPASEKFRKAFLFMLGALCTLVAIYTVSQKESPTLLIVAWRRITRFIIFWYEHSWHNWPSNDRSISHLTQCLLLHYLGKTEHTQ